MSDLIRREDLVKELNAQFAVGDITREIANDILNHIPSAESVRKWIPVTKALPWNDTNVLVTVRDDSGDTPWEHTSVGWRTPDGQYWVVDNEICYGVISWMPLPEPWRADR